MKFIRIKNFLIFILSIYLITFFYVAKAKDSTSIAPPATTPKSIIIFATGQTGYIYANAQTSIRATLTTTTSRCPSQYTSARLSYSLSYIFASNPIGNLTRVLLSCSLANSGNGYTATCNDARGIFSGLDGGVAASWTIHCIP